MPACLSPEQPLRVRGFPKVRLTRRHPALPAPSSAAPLPSCRVVRPQWEAHWPIDLPMPRSGPPPGLGREGNFPTGLREVPGVPRVRAGMTGCPHMCTCVHVRECTNVPVMRVGHVSTVWTRERPSEPMCSPGDSKRAPAVALSRENPTRWHPGHRSGTLGHCPHRPAPPPEKQSHLTLARVGAPPARCSPGSIVPACHQLFRGRDPSFLHKAVAAGAAGLDYLVRRCPRETCGTGRCRPSAERTRSCHGSCRLAPGKPGRALGVPGEPLSTLGSHVPVLSTAF